MKEYRAYMDRQQVSPALHARLAALEQTASAPAARRNAPLRHWKPLLAAAACLCLVLGLSWGLLFSQRFRTDSSAVVSDSFHTMTTDAADSTQESAESDADAGEAAAEDIAEDAEAESAAEDTMDTADSVSSSGEEPAAAALSLPEDALCPGWLPEDSTLIAAEPMGEDSTDGYLLRWRTGDGTELTMVYFYTDTAPTDTDWTVWDWDSADWAQISASEAQDGLWGFGLYDSGSGLFCQFTTTGRDYEQLWRMARSAEP